MSGERLDTTERGGRYERTDGVIVDANGNPVDGGASAETQSPPQAEPSGPALPSDDYDTLSVDAVLDRLEQGDLDPVAVLEYERANRNRVSIIRPLTEED